MASFSKLDLHQLVNASKDDYVDNTDVIRKLKHSQILGNDVNVVLSTIVAADAHNKNIPPNEPTITDEMIAESCAKECPTLYNGYNDIFMRLLKKEIDVGILFQVLNVLREIEDGEVDHEAGSVKVGKLLYSMFVDSRIRETNNKDFADKEAIAKLVNADLSPEQLEEDHARKTMTWKQYRCYMEKKRFVNEQQPLTNH